jgi:hypothetical protein
MASSILGDSEYELNLYNERKEYESNTATRTSARTD